MRVKSLRQNRLVASVVVLAAGALQVGALIRHSSAPPQAPPPILLSQELSFLRPGDLVFRRGESTLSAAVMSLDSQSLYSHAGIVARAGATLVIVHSTVDEPPDRAGSVRTDSIAAFLAPERAVAAAVYRLRDDGIEARTTAELASRNAFDFAARHVPFDRSFDLDSAGAVYCTELIWRAYRQAGMELVSGDFPTISFGLKRRRAIFPSTLQESARLQLIWHK